MIASSIVVRIVVSMAVLSLSSLDAPSLSCSSSSGGGVHDIVRSMMCMCIVHHGGGTARGHRSAGCRGCYRHLILFVIVIVIIVV